MTISFPNKTLTLLTPPSSTSISFVRRYGAFATRSPLLHHQPPTSRGPPTSASPSPDSSPVIVVLVMLRSSAPASSRSQSSNCAPPSPASSGAVLGCQVSSITSGAGQVLVAGFLPSPPGEVSVRNPSAEGKFIIFVSAKVETENPQAELKSGGNVLGSVDEMFLDIYDIY